MVLPYAAALAVLAVFGVLLVVILRRGSMRAGELRAAAHSLVDLCPDGILCATAKGEILSANPAVLRMLGYTEAELLGKSAFDIIHPDSHEVVRRRMSEAVLGRVNPWVEEKWVRRDGSTVIVVEVAAVSVSKEGRIGWMMFMRDLTERKKAEQELRASNERFRALFENALDAILMFDNNNRYIDANASAVALLGYSRDEILTKSVGDFTPDSDRATNVRTLTSDHGSGEATLVRKSGALFNVEYRFDANIVPGTHCVFFVDITDRKALERTSQQFPAKLLESQDQERRRIARQLHETTAQTLAALRLNLARMRDAATDGMAALLKESSELTDQGIREVRTLSHLLHPPLIEDLGVVAALRWYIEGFSQRSGIAVELDAPEDLGRFSGALENGIFRIVQEALTNIHRHSGSKVARVSLSRKADELSVVIEDDGKGMPVPEPGKPMTRGVGLTTMQERAKELGGRMQIISSEQGTRIDVKLHVTDDGQWQSSAS